MDSEAEDPIREKVREVWKLYADFPPTERDIDIVIDSRERWGIPYYYTVIHRIDFIKEKGNFSWQPTNR